LREPSFSDPRSTPKGEESMKMRHLIEAIESKFVRRDLPPIDIGDTIKIGMLIQEGNKQRVQPYEGTVIAKHRAGLGTTVTVRRVFQGVGVERVFAVHSPSIQSVAVMRRAKVRRAKLYYLRARIGKGTRLAPRLTP
jgi:large subunit ribosomal protein L19